MEQKAGKGGHENLKRGGLLNQDKAQVFGMGTLTRQSDLNSEAVRWFCWISQVTITHPNPQYPINQKSIPINQFTPIAKTSKCNLCLAKRNVPQCQLLMKIEIVCEIVQSYVCKQRCQFAFVYILCDTDYTG